MRVQEDRLHRCRRCGRWFAGVTIGAAGAYCSRDCYMRRTVCAVFAVCARVTAAAFAADAVPYCDRFEPDHNGECVNCDEWAGAHLLEPGE